LPALLAPLGAGLIPAQRERVLRNDEVGFELVYPEGWSAVGAGMLTAPASFPRARVGIEWHANDKLPVRLKSRLVVRLRQSGVTGLEATDGDARVVAGIDALDFRCSFVAAGARWTERIVIVPTATGSYAVVLRGREEDMAGLATGFEEILAGFRILGGR
jgi:hypothetical protein